MDKEFFRPTWKKIIGFLIINCIALAIYLYVRYSPVEGGLLTFLEYSYSVLTPFSLLANLLIESLSGAPSGVDYYIGGSWNGISTPMLVCIGIVQNILELAWQYLIACFIIRGLSILTMKNAVIITPKKRR